MDRQEIFEWVKSTYGTEPDYPWLDENAVFRHNDNGKWYGVIIEVSKNKLGLKENEIVDILNIKCDPILIGSLRRKEGYFPAFHMNKENWISVSLDGSISSDEIKDLLDLSYKLTKIRKKKK